MQTTASFHPLLLDLKKKHNNVIVLQETIYSPVQYIDTLETHRTKITFKINQ